jgi:hypothetical protein
MNRHEIFPDLHFPSFRQKRFNIEFTPGTVVRCAACRHTPTINHARLPFTENKRYRMKPRRFSHVVNRNAASVYQTDAVLILVGGVQGRLKRALPKTDSIKTKQYRVR